MIVKKMSLMNNKSQTYQENFINEVRTYLKLDFGISGSNCDYLIEKFKKILQKDASYVFHYDSQYWARYIAEASGLVREMVTV